jgi:hypothetical protein
VAVRIGRISAARAHLPVVAIVLAAAALAASYAGQATNWAVMTDELQTARLATSIANTLSPVPRIHGEYYHALSQLYPLLAAPFFGLLTAPQAIDALHVLNGLLFASAAWPASLLAYAVTRSRAAGYVAAALTAFVPWLVLSATLLTENAAYPAFVWCVFLAHRTLTAPSTRADLAALAGVVVAFCARTQLIVLALALPLALVAHEVVYALARARRGRLLAAARDGAARALSSHRLLVGAYGVAAIAAVALASAGRLEQVLGTYAGTVQGDLLPRGIWRAVAVHFDAAVVGVGIAPFLLAGAWGLVALVRPRSKAAHAYAALLAVIAPLVIVEASSFDVRFTPGAFTQDRYVAYLAPLLAVGTAAAFLDPDRRSLRAALVLVLAAAFSALAALASFGHAEVIFWAAPAAAFHGALAGIAAAIGLSGDWLVRSGALAVGALLALAVWRAPPLPALVATGLAVVAFGTAEVVYVFEHFAVPLTTRPRLIATARRDWIDASLPDGATAALVPYPYLRPEYWWDAELWNKQVDRVLRIDGGTTYTPFPAASLSVDPSTGAIRGLAGRRFLVVAATETRIRPARATTVASALPLTLVRVGRAPRADWTVSGALPDGWSRPGRPVTLRVYAGGGKAGRREVELTVAAPPGRRRPFRFVVLSGRANRAGVAFPGAPARVRISLCAPARGFAKATLASRDRRRIADGRTVGVRLAHVDVVRTGRSC